MDSQPLVTVIIPVFGMGESFPACLEALENQTFPKEQYEILVVDNDPSKPLVLPPHSRASVLCESTPGSYAARNKGAAHARGEILAFTDADCLPATNWLARGVEILQNLNGRAIVGGSIVCTFTQAHAPTTIELFDALRSYDQARFVNDLHFAATANFFIPKRHFESLGGFDSRLKSCGDLDLCLRAQENGIPIHFAQAARIEHRARRTLRELTVWTRRVAGGHLTLERLGRSAPPRSLHARARTLVHWIRAFMKLRKSYLPLLFLFIVFTSAIGRLETLRLRLGGAPIRK